MWLRIFVARHFFHINPPAILAAVAVLGGGLLAVSPAPPTADADVTVWTFAPTHYDGYRAAAAEVAHADGLRVDVGLVHHAALDQRLRAAFSADLPTADLVEVGADKAAALVRGPLEHAGFLDLAAFLDRPDDNGRRFRDNLLPGRLAQLTVARPGREDYVFGLPHDVHPVALAYRADVFAEHGIAPAAIKTWDDFFRLGARVVVPGKRYLVELDDTGVMTLETLLSQQGGDYLDARGRLTMDSPVAADLLLWYVRRVAGPHAVSANAGYYGPQFDEALRDGYLVSFLCPDWRTKVVQDALPGLAGRFALMPLPAFRPGGRRTAAAGGTMLGIPRTSRDPEAAWRLARRLYLDRDMLALSFRSTHVVPPYRPVWDHPVFAEPNPFWSGQPLGRLYLELAEQAPPRVGSPYRELARSKLADVLTGCLARYRRHGEDGFEEYARNRLAAAAEYVRAQMRRDRF